MGGNRSARWRVAAGVWAAVWLAASSAGQVSPSGTPARAEQTTTQASSTLEVAAVDTSDYPAVGVTLVAREGVPEADDLSVTEDGVPRPATVDPLADRPLEVVVVLDTSAGAGGELRQAVAGVTEFALRLPPDAEVGVVAAGGRPRLAVAPTRDAAAVVAALAGLRAGGKPRMLDAVPLAVNALPSGGELRRALVLVGGGDSPAALGRLREAAELLRAAGVPVFAVAPPGDTAAELAAAAGGTVERVADLSETSASLSRVAGDLGSLYRVEFRATGTGATQVGVAVRGQAATETAVTVTLPSAAGAPTVAADGAEGPPDRTVVWLLAAAYVGGSVLLLRLAMALDERREGSRRRPSRRLRRRLTTAVRLLRHRLAGGPRA